MTYDHENQLKLTQFKHQLFRMRILVVFMQLLSFQTLLYSFKNVKPVSYLQSWELREEVKIAVNYLINQNCTNISVEIHLPELWSHRLIFIDPYNIHHVIFDIILINSTIFIIDNKHYESRNYSNHFLSSTV